ncbi:MAG: hypothetical protein ACE5KT_04110 [Methanosarcinales archaeon]
MKSIKIKADNVKKGDAIPIKGENKYLELKAIHTKGVYGFVEGMIFFYREEPWRD